MRDRHGMVAVECVDPVLTAAPDDALMHLSHAGALMRRHIDGVIGAGRDEPDRWIGARIEDVVAMLDTIATMAASEADRLRDFGDRHETLP